MDIPISNQIANAPNPARICVIKTVILFTIPVNKKIKLNPIEITKFAGVEKREVKDRMSNKANTIIPVIIIPMIISFQVEPKLKKSVTLITIWEVGDSSKTAALTNIKELTNTKDNKTKLKPLLFILYSVKKYL
jgi:hypothetical protein